MMFYWLYSKGKLKSVCVCVCETCTDLENSARGPNNLFLFKSSCKYFPEAQEAIGPNWTPSVHTSQGGSVPEFLRRPITTCEFSGDLDSLSPACLDPPM